MALMRVSRMFKPAILNVLAQRAPINPVTVKILMSGIVRPQALGGGQNICSSRDLNFEITTLLMSSPYQLKEIAFTN